MKYFILLSFCFISLQNSEDILSVQELFENRQKFVGKTVRVKGYYVNEFENHVLYPSKEGTYNIDFSPWLEVTDSTIYINSNYDRIRPYAVNHRTAIVTGRFNFKEKYDPAWSFNGFGHLGVHRAQLENISVVQFILDSIPPLEKLRKP